MTLMQRSNELNTFGVTNTIYRYLLYRATGGNLPIKGGRLLRWGNNIINQPYDNSCSDLMVI